MRFRPSHSPPNYLSRRFQYRVLAMVLLLSLVLIAMQTAADPKTWYWLTGPPPVEGEEEPRRPASLEDIDFSVQLKDGRGVPLRDDEFLSEHSQETPIEPDEPPGDERTDGEEAGRAGPNADRPDQESNDPAAGDEETSEQLRANRPRAIPTEWDVQVDKQSLAHVRDNKLGIWADESDAYYSLLARARAVPTRVLEAAARDDLAFAVLMVDSDAFRGELVTVTGEVRRLWTLPAAANDYGIEDVYEAWMLTPDSGENPWVVRFTSLPDGFPQGESIQARVRVTGYFFKRYGYASQQGLHTAPMLLAKRIQWIRPRPAATQHDSGIMAYVLGFVAVLGTGLAALLWYFTAGDRKFHRNYLKRVTQTPRDLLEGLENVPTTDVDDLFRTMSENAAEEERTGGEGE